MKIALSLEEVSFGGGPKFSLNLAGYLTQVGHDVTVIAEQEGVWWPELSRLGLKGHAFSFGRCVPNSRRAFEMAAFWNYQRYDAIIINASLLNRVAHLASHMLDEKTALMTILHGDWDPLYEMTARDREIWNCAVAVSPRVHEGAVKRVPGKPVICIPNGVEIPVEAELAERRGWASPLRLLFAGRLIDSHKGIFRLPPILAECRRRGLPVALTVIGEGEDGTRLESRFAAEGLADMVTMSGRLPPSEIARAMRDHHLFLFPTNTEGMPLAVLEAQANGCVVIGTHLPGITDVAIDDGVTGRLFAMGDIAGCVDDISDMMVPEVWNRHSVAGIVRSRDLFSIPSMGKRYAELLNDLSKERYSVNRPQGRGSVPLVWDDYLPIQLVPHPVMRIAGKARAAVRRLTGIRQGSR